MRSCRCGALWRVNFPFGVNGGSRISFVRCHSRGCRFGKVKRFNRIDGEVIL